MEGGEDGALSLFGVLWGMREGGKGGGREKEGGRKAKRGAHLQQRYMEGRGVLIGCEGIYLYKLHAFTEKNKL